MSKIVAKSDKYLTLERYIHNEPEEYSSWEIDESGHQKYNDLVHEAEHFAFFENKVQYRIDIETGEVIYLMFDGKRIVND